MNRSRNNKWVCLALLFCLALPAWYTIAFYFQRHAFHLKAERNLEKDSLQTIQLPASQLHWKRKGKEIIVQGRYFDVKRIEYRGSSVLLTGLYDDDETRLHQNFDQQWEEDWKHSGKPGIIANWCSENWIYTSISLDISARKEWISRLYGSMKPCIFPGFPTHPDMPPRA